MYESAAHLVVHANDYLDSLEGKPPEAPEEARERARHIYLLISEMRRFNFHAPKFGVGALFRDLRFAEKEELLEAAPFIQSFLYTLNVRKWTYERAKIAYLANRLSYFLLQSEVMGDVLSHLPYGGSYLRPTERAGGTAFLVIRDLEKLLRGDSGYELVFEEEKLVDVRRRGGRGLFPSSTAILLASLSTSQAVESVWNDILKAERREISNYERLVEYERVVGRYDLRRVYENPELFWDLMQELEEAGFLSEDGTVDPDILNALRKRRHLRYNRLYAAASSHLTLFLIRYYLYFTPRTRRYSPPLRGMPDNPGKILVVLGEVDLPVCKASKREVVELVRKCSRIHSLVPFPPKDVGDALIYKICPSLGRRLPAVERAVEAVLRGSERARRFRELMGDLRDNDKDEGGSGETR